MSPPSRGLAADASLLGSEQVLVRIIVDEQTLGGEPVRGRRDLGLEEVYARMLLMMLHRVEVTVENPARGIAAVVVVVGRPCGWRRVVVGVTRALPRMMDGATAAKRSRSA